jgi:hypothetical protein
LGCDGGTIWVVMIAGHTGGEARGRGGVWQTEVAMSDNQRRVVLIVLGVAIFSASFFLSLGLLRLLD